MRVRDLLVSMLMASRGGLTDRTTWRNRMRACHGCIVYDRARHSCRDTMGLGTGCGCWMPLKAMFRGPQCWVRVISPDGPYGHLG